MSVVKTVKSTRVSKRSVIIDIMTKNATKSMQDVVKLIVSSTAFVHHARPEEEARYYYGKFVRTGVAPGTIVRAPRKVKNLASKPVKSKPTDAAVPVVKPTDAAVPVVKPVPLTPSIPSDDLTVPDFLKRIKPSSAVAG